MTSLVTSLLVSLVISQLVPETALVRAPAPLREEMERIAVLLSELKWRDKEGDALDKIRKLAAAARPAAAAAAQAAAQATAQVAAAGGDPGEEAGGDDGGKAEGNSGPDSADM
jgi:flagellar biosynthesis/type III secretory pathway protein FliH